MGRSTQGFLTDLDDVASPRIDTILVADRGEIAVRVIRTCRDLGIRSVAVYSDEDRDGTHAHLADEAFALGSAGMGAYLDVDRVLRLARAAGADAIHPGCGSLSEDAGFATEVEAAGLAWIGPPPGVIAQLGETVRARALATEVGVPLVLGTDRSMDGAQGAIDLAETHGPSVVTRGADGGGGVGLKTVLRREGAASQHAAAVRALMAASHQGERLGERSRHVEAQCLADAHGTVVVVSTRDCTLQRGGQRLVEEAPAPFLGERQRQHIVESSRRLLEAAGYVGAGTCQFLVGQDGSVDLLRVSSRLQVEHPVTEEATGVDLVAEQIRLARGARLVPGDPEVRGHAIAFRIKTEDAAQGLLPQAGTLRRYQLPEGPGVRVDSGVRAGTEFAGAVGSLLAKVVVVGNDRDHALRRARRALAELDVDGVARVVPLYRALLEHPDFCTARGRSAIHTQWLDRHEDLVPPDSDTGDRHHGGVAIDVDSEDPTSVRFVVEVDSRRVQVQVATATMQRLLQPVVARAGAAGQKPPPRRSLSSRATTAGQGVSEVTAPMNGTVVKVLARAGDGVDAKDALVVLEAMKMELPVISHVSGVVSAVHCREGEAVVAGAPLVTVVQS
jgi:acetyl-CoA/propionyl-CoA carboxylase biotin carboxyl carrier protein